MNSRQFLKTDQVLFLIRTHSDPAQGFALASQERRKERTVNNCYCQKFDCLAQRDWKALLTLLKLDEGFSSRRMQAKRCVRATEETQDNAERKRETVLKCMAKGQISMAVKGIGSDGVAKLDNPRVKELLKTKYPACHRPLPLYVSKGQCIYNLSFLKETIFDIESGMSPDQGGLGGELLTVLAEVWNEAEMDRL